MNTQVLFSDQIKSFKVEAFLAARKLQLRRISSLDKIASLPVTLRLTETSICVLFRYGVVVFFNATQADKNNFFEEFSEQFISKFDSPEIEHLEVVLRSDAKECFETDCVVLNDTSLPKLQLLAESLAKSVILAHNESELVHAFDQIEPLALDLSQKGRPSQNTRQLQKLIGNILLREHTLVARAEASDRPELLWEHPDLTNLYTTLSYELELNDRAKAIQEKIDLATKIVSTTVDLIQNQSTLRVEWLIVVLILVEILISILEHTKIL